MSKLNEPTSPALQVDSGRLQSMEWQRVRYHLATRKQQTEWNRKALSNLSVQIFQEADAEKWLCMQEIYKRKHLLVKGVRATRTWDSPIVRQTYSEWRGRRKEENLNGNSECNEISRKLWQSYLVFFERITKSIQVPFQNGHVLSPPCCSIMDWEYPIGNTASTPTTVMDFWALNLER